MLKHLEKRDGPMDDHHDLLIAIEKGDLLDVAEELRERLGPDEFRRFIKDRIRGLGLKPTDCWSASPSVSRSPLPMLGGFDEMARKADYQTVVDNFWALAKLAEDESKVVLTSRSQSFR
jgi:hypothetical protein